MIKPYDPQFSHKDWIDNQDRVQAGGADGLNSRFHQLEDEFAGLADNQINPILGMLGTAAKHLTLVPTLFRYSESGAELQPWSQGVDMVEKAANATEAHGIMNIALPDGVLVRSLLMTGANQSASATLTVALKARKTDNTGGGAKTLVSSTKLDVAAQPTEEVRITNESFRYFLTVDLTSAEPNKPVKVFCVQFVYE
ncbi:hypothetical protein [Streptomyces sp. NRRL F-5193]|uniref:hypothetical protein n=1 Tax=Streptomyces sp. NRRL F-5193 TaxID=1463860 RepID=UPI0005BC72C6|nr:hypothetical protein [Streptomyces sp. NRRL F-5193]